MYTENEYHTTPAPAPAVPVRERRPPAPLDPPAGEPRVYEVHRAAKAIKVDGKLDDKAWKKAEWTEDFVDIEGPIKPNPRFKTHAKLLWDDQYLYIAAELEEPDVKASITQHDAVIFHDNDFEVFIKPLANEEEKSINTKS